MTVLHIHVSTLLLTNANVESVCNVIGNESGRMDMCLALLTTNLQLGCQ